MHTKTSSALVADAVFLNGAIAIGNHLISIATIDGDQVSWRNIDPLTGKNKPDSNELYAGISGIGLFFLELYKQTHQKRYLRIATNALLTAASREILQPSGAAFITGRLGVAYALAELYKVTGSKAYMRQALELAKAHRHPSGLPCEFINGDAGALLAFLHLHAISQEPWLLEAVNTYAGSLIQRAQPATIGIYWDRSPSASQPLCGFSHGTSGIGFVFLELGHYLKNSAYYAVAEQAFAYENACFDATKRNWPDFRLNMWKREEIAAMEKSYSQGDWQVFEQAKDMAAWCHGAPGIALSRIRGYQLIRDRTYLQDLNRAMAKTKESPLGNLCLCHGLAGNLDAYIESYKVLKRRKPWANARASGLLLLDEATTLLTHLHAGDPLPLQRRPLGLFVGLAGVGYNLLRLYDPVRTASILAPRLTTTITKKPGTELQFLRLSRRALQEMLEEIPGNKDPRIQAVKRDMIAHYPNSAKLFIRQRLRFQNVPSMGQLPDDQLLDAILQLDENCSLHIASANQPVLLRYTASGIDERLISPFCYLVLKAFLEPRTAGEVITLLHEHSSKLPVPQQRLLQAKVLEQAREALRAALLVES